MRNPSVSTSLLLALWAVIPLPAQQTRPATTLPAVSSHPTCQTEQLESLAQAVQAQPGDLTAIRNLLEAYLRTERFDAADALLARSLQRMPAESTLRLWWADAALAQDRPACALRRLQELPPRERETPAVCFRLARCYYALDRVIGDAQIRTVPDGRPGQFVGGYLLVEPRPGADRFLCCPPASALFMLRQALDGGFDEPAAHVLHARIWCKLDRPTVAHSVLKNRAAVLLANPDPDVLLAFSEVALAADALRDYVRYEQLRGQRDPTTRQEILVGAYLMVAERFALRGDNVLRLQWLHRAADLRPDDPAVLARLGDAAWEADKHAQAGAAYRRLLRVRPNHPRKPEILHRLADTPHDAMPR